MQLNYNLLTDIDRLLSYKEKSLEKTTFITAKKAIEIEILKLKQIRKKVMELTVYINSLEKKYGESALENQNLEDAKTIAELVSVMHGIKAEEIQLYYNFGLDYAIDKMEQLQEENQIIIPAGLKKYVKK